MRHLITILFLVAAIAAYAMSAGPGIIGSFFILGMLFEGIVWYRLLLDRKRKPASSDQRTALGPNQETAHGRSTEPH